MANILDQFARAVLAMNGMPAAEVTRRARLLKQQGKPQKPLPKPAASKPPAKGGALAVPNMRATSSPARVRKVEPPAPEPKWGSSRNKPAANPPKGGALALRNDAKPTTTSTRVRASQPAAPVPQWTDSRSRPQGQTNLFNAQGDPRDFRNPRVSANRPPTITPVSTRSGASATPPNARPSRVSPGQLEMRLQVGEGSGKPVRPSIGTVSGPASSPAQSNGKGTGTRRGSIANVTGPASSPAPSNGKGTGTVRGSIANVSGPASSPAPSNGKGTGTRRPSIRNVTGPATSPKAPGSAPIVGKGSAIQNAVSSSKSSGPIGANSRRGMAAELAIGALLSPAVNAAGNAAGRFIGDNILKPMGKAMDAAPGGTRFRNPNQGGAKTKQDTVGTRPKPAPVKDYKDSQGNTYDGNSGRLKTKAPVKPPQGASRPSGNTIPPSTTSRPPAAASRPQSGGSGNRSRGASALTVAPTSRPSSATPAVSPPKRTAADNFSTDVNSGVKPMTAPDYSTGKVSARQFDTSSNLSQAKKERPSRGPTGREDMIAENIRRARKRS